VPAAPVTPRFFHPEFIPETKPIMNNSRKTTLLAFAACALLRFAPITSGAETPFETAKDGDWDGTIEIETERVKVPGGSDFRSDSLAFIYGYRVGPNKFDFKLEGDKDHDAAAGTGEKIEFRYRRYFTEIAGIEPSLRMSVGENMQSGNGSSFGYYTVQPKLVYALGNGMEPYVSVRYRQRIAGGDWHTWTSYFGIAFEIGKSWEIEPSIFTKTGIEKTNGCKVEITRKF
jgi:hypothetical protein